MSTEKPPSILYHYTSQEGLLGIIKDMEVWATDIFYLNDTVEYKYAVDLTSEIIKKRQELCSENPPAFFSQTIEPKKKSIVPSFPYRYDKEWIEYNMLDDFHNLIQCFEENHIFVFSLSKNGDSLSQWRGYCSQGNGYSIGFNTSAFRKLMVKKGLRFVKCIYVRKEQEEIINDTIDNYVNEIRNTPELSDSEEKRKVLTIRCMVRFLDIATKLKNESFEGEEEWRVTSVPLRETNFIKFREGKSTIIPYIKIKIDDDNGNMPIEEVIISPTSHKQLSNHAVNLLLSCKEIESCIVKNSKIPYRS